MPPFATIARYQPKALGLVAAPILLMSLLLSCSKKPDGPGVCSIDCNQAIVAGNDFVFTLRATATNLALKCTTPGNFQRPIEAKFLLSQNTGDSQNQRPTPVPFASIAPLVYGDLAAVNDPNPELKYQGILTPKSQWCSDSCGVVTLELLPLCPATGKTSQTTIALSSGPLSSDQNFTFTVESQ